MRTALPASRLLPVYLLLKVFHLRRLYSAASELAKDQDHWDVADLGKIRLVFWDGAMVGSGPKSQTP